jgi:putative spermidine/putrescine transport system substrate-binding protein
MDDQKFEATLRRLELASRIRRRQFLRLMAAAGLGAVSLGTLAACRQEPAAPAPGGAATPAEGAAGPGPEFKVAGYDDPNKWKGKTLVFAGFGGAMADAQRKAIFEPFNRLTGAEIVEDSTSADKLKVQVDSGNVEWSVCQLGPIEAAVLGRKYLEPIDYSIVDRSTLLEDVAHECDVGVIFWSTILAYRTDESGDKPPQGWTDFWNVDSFPGPRALDKFGPWPNLEFALMADGVAMNEVYSLLRTADGIDRAFASLDRIKPHVAVWWEAGAQPAQLLTDGEVTMSSAWNGRIDAIQREGAPVAIQWNQGLLSMDSFMVPKGVKDKELAMDFINFATRPEPQAELAKLIPYSPTNSKAFDLLSQELKERLPSSPELKAKQLLHDFNFWIEHLVELDERFAAWLAG